MADPKHTDNPSEAGTGRWERTEDQDPTKRPDMEPWPPQESRDVEQRADQAQPTLARSREADPRISPGSMPTAAELQADAARAEAAGEPVRGDGTIPAPLGGPDGGYRPVKIEGAGPGAAPDGTAPGGTTEVVGSTGVTTEGMPPQIRPQVGPDDANTAQVEAEATGENRTIRRQ